MLARHYGAAARTKRISRPYAPLVLCQYSLPYWSGERMTSFYPLWELFRNARARYEDPDWEHICADYCISEKKNIFLNEEIVNRKIAGLGVQMFSTVLCTISLSSNLRKHFNITCYVIFYSLRFVRISAGRGWWKELSSTWRKEMWLSRPSVQMRCSRFVLPWLRFAQKNLRKVEETQIKKPTQSKI